MPSVAAAHPVAAMYAPTPVATVRPRTPVRRTAVDAVLAATVGLVGASVRAPRLELLTLRRGEHGVDLLAPVLTNLTHGRLALWTTGRAGPDRLCLAPSVLANRADLRLLGGGEAEARAHAGKACLPLLGRAPSMLSPMAAPRMTAALSGFVSLSGLGSGSALRIGVADGRGTEREGAEEGGEGEGLEDLGHVGLSLSACGVWAALLGS